MIVDTDSHIIEPPDVFTDRMSAKRWGDLIPHVRHDDERGDGWYVGETRFWDAWANAFAMNGPGAELTRRKEYGGQPLSMELVHPSAYDAAARLKVMDEAGIRAAALYPNLGLLFTPLIDRMVKSELSEYRLECVQVYNDFVCDWIAPGPDRFIALANIPFWDVAASVREIERCAALGFKGVVMTGLPHLHGQPYLADRHWDPLWEVASRHDMPVSFHLGGGDLTKALPPERVAVEGWNATVARTTVNLFFENAATLADLLLSGILARFADLKFVVVESGIGWIPFCLEAVDYHFVTSGVRHERPEFQMLPSEYFRRQVYANFWFEILDPTQVEKVGVSNILFETDYPHPTSLLGAADVAATVKTGFEAVDSTVRDAILWRNAAELYRLDLPSTDDANSAFHGR